MAKVEVKLRKYCSYYNSSTVSDKAVFSHDRQPLALCDILGNRLLSPDFSWNPINFQLYAEYASFSHSHVLV